MDLPIEGYPISETAVREWFRTRHGRDATAEEAGDILLAMAERDTTPPREGGEPQFGGWTPPLPPPEPQDR